MSVDWDVIAALLDGLSLADKGRAMELAVLIGRVGSIPNDDHAIGRLLGIRPCRVAAYRPIIESKFDIVISPSDLVGRLRLRSNFNETVKFDRNGQNRTADIVQISTKRSNLTASRARRDSSSESESCVPRESRYESQASMTELDSPSESQAYTFVKNAKNQKRARPKQSSTAARLMDVEAAFGRFWQAYPRRVGKGAAKASFAKACLNGTDPDAILTGIALITPVWAQRGEPQYIPHPATWLNQRRWEDDPPAQTQSHQKAVDPVAADPNRWMYGR